jgi:hypothetical protein
MVETDDASNLPSAIFVLPEHYELRLSHFIVVSGVVETMNTDLYSAIVGYGVNLQCSRNKFPRDFAADVVPDSIHKCLTAKGQARLVVLKLQILGNQGRNRG